MSPAQRETLQFIRDFIARHGYAPTLREIANHRGVQVGSVQTALRRLERDRFIERTPRVARSIRLVEFPK